MNIKDLIEAVKFQVSIKPQDEFMAEVAERLETLNGKLETEKAKVKRLKEEIKTFTVDKKIVDHFAVKEFAEKLCEGRVSNDPVVIAVKVELEMVGDEE